MAIYEAGHGYHPQCKEWSLHIIDGYSVLFLDNYQHVYIRADCNYSIGVGPSRICPTSQCDGVSVFWCSIRFTCVSNGGFLNFTFLLPVSHHLNPQLGAQAVPFAFRRGGHGRLLGGGAAFAKHAQISSTGHGYIFPAYG